MPRSWPNYQRTRGAFDPTHADPINDPYTAPHDELPEEPDAGPGTEATRDETDAKILVESLYRKFGRNVFRVLRSHGADPDVAQDLLHDATMKLGERLRRATIDDPEPYYMKIAINLWRDWLKKAENTKVLPSDTLNENASDPAGEDPFEKVIDAHDRKAVYAATIAALDQLSAQQRNVIEYTAFTTMTSLQIGRVLGMSEANVRYHLSRARAHLKAILELNGIGEQEAGQ